MQSIDFRPMYAAVGALALFCLYKKRDLEDKVKPSCKSNELKQVKTYVEIKQHESVHPDNPIRVEIEYCTGCRWMLRAGWMAQELLTTFMKDLGGVTLVPNSSQGGTFIVRVYDMSKEEGDRLVAIAWDRKEKGRFPESKELKQIIRDYVAPKRDLGHSDKKIDN